jgi:hypothetical protein
MTVTDTNASTAQGSHDHQMLIDKIELYPVIPPQTQQSFDLSCPNSGIAVDGTVEVVKVEPGNDPANPVPPTELVVMQASSIDLGTYRFTVNNRTSDNAQVRPYVVCMSAFTDSDSSGHRHPINVGDLTSITTGVQIPGLYSYEMPVSEGHHAVAQGIEVLNDGVATIVSSEPLPNGNWKFIVRVTESADIRLSIRELDDVTGISDNNPAHVHALGFRHVQRTVTVQPGITDQIRVSCPVGYKGIDATYDLPEGLTLLGSSPQPINRDFTLYNGTDGPLSAVLDLECVSIRVGPPTGVVGPPVDNTATVASTVLDPDEDNNSNTLSVFVGASGTPVPPTNSTSPPGTGPGGSTGAVGDNKPVGDGAGNKQQGPSPGGGPGGSSAGGAAPGQPPEGWAPGTEGVGPPAPAFEGEGRQEGAGPGGKATDKKPTAKKSAPVTVTVASDGATATIKLSCPKGGKNCAGTIAFAATLPVKKGKKTKQLKTKLGQAKFKVKPGKSATVRIKIASKHRKALRSGKAKKATVSVNGGKATSVKLVVKKAKKK